MLTPILISVSLMLIAYILGSIPTGYLIGKWTQGIDIREFGSGSIGATNVLRTLGKGPGSAVLGFDMFKGMVAVGLVKAFYLLFPDTLPLDWYFWLMTGAAVSAVIGHSKSIFLGFSGGKSVATSLGVLLIMSPLVALGTLVSFLVMLAIFRIVSLGSITGAIVVNLLMIVLNQPLPYILFAAFAGSYVVIRHKANIARLLTGQEPKIGEKLSEG
ncbi:MAG: Glycerol-3-phosphate acyltransferase [Chroococcopsis gigantea SAG 12.99]|jgi:glycerol-3-phosphate acyltransferase PlsY|nr:glycerol-3-phosphate 1-O-acyltransferase PlsY [Chlorogloea purpurea SAG 13.99]MDV2998526.1 Glycerol-3-phosphate acyltransferase [Chroococcopsis gigantea SAG 12.99]